MTASDCCFTFSTSFRTKGAKSYPLVEFVFFSKHRPMPRLLRAQHRRRHPDAAHPQQTHCRARWCWSTTSRSTRRASPASRPRRSSRAPNTIYNLYQEVFGLTVVRTEERLRAEAASAEHAKLLKLKPSTPVLTIRRTAFDMRDEPTWELRVSTVNTAAHEYFAEAPLAPLP